MTQEQYNVLLATVAGTCYPGVVAIGIERLGKSYFETAVWEAKNILDEAGVIDPSTVPKKDYSDYDPFVPEGAL